MAKLGLVGFRDSPGQPTQDALDLGRLAAVMPGVSRELPPVVASDEHDFAALVEQALRSGDEPVLVPQESGQPESR